jgi:hypothetical protein
VLLFLIVFAIHLAPAFTPPTWPVIVLYSLNTQLPIGWLILTAGLAAALGRHSLARLSNLLARWFPAKARRNLDAARTLVEQRRAGRLVALGLFVLTPVPSAQLFEAVVLAGARVWPCTLAFLLGRLGFYSIYAVSARRVQATSLGDTFLETLTSPLGIAVQVAVITILVLIIRTDWSRWLQRRR